MKILLIFAAVLLAAITFTQTVFAYEKTEIIVQFRTPPAVELRLINESGFANEYVRAFSGLTYEAQALTAHENFMRQLGETVVPFGIGGAEILSANHRLFNGVTMRVSPHMVEAIANLSEVHAVFPRTEIFIPTPVIGELTPFSGTAPQVINPAFMQETREFLQADYIHNTLGVTGAGVRVAVIDSGIDHNHPEFERFLDNTDRIRGWENHDNSYATENWDWITHGTHVAGIVIALAPNIELWKYNVFGANAMQLICAIEEAHENTDVMNLSLGTAFADTPFHPHNIAVNNAARDGSVVVVAAGNDGPGLLSSQPPGNASLPISVGAGTAGGRYSTEDTIAPFSSRGPVQFFPGHIKPDIVAPGVQIYSALPLSTGFSYGLMGGTSMAAPMIAGIAALLLEEFPNATPCEIKARIMNTARPLADLDAPNVFYTGAGFVCAVSALTRNGAAFATVEHSIPWGEPAQRVCDVCDCGHIWHYTRPSSETAVMSSLSFGSVMAERTSPELTVTIHNAQGVWTAQEAVFNGNSNGVNLNAVPNGNGTFALTMTFAEYAENGTYQGNIIFTSETGGEITKPFAVSFYYGAVDITDSFECEIFLAVVRRLANISYPSRIFTPHLHGIVRIQEWNSGITSLAGVEHFRDLNHLTIYTANLTEIDVSQNLELNVLTLRHNQLTEIDVSNNIALDALDLWGNYLTEIDVSNNHELTWLDIRNNNFTTLDVSQNPRLDLLFIQNNNFTTLDVSNQNVSQLYVYGNYFTRPDDILGWRNNIHFEPGYATDLSALNRFKFWPQNLTAEPVITFGNFRDGVIGVEFSQLLTAEGGGLTWSISYGELPNGLELQPNGQLGGRFGQLGAFTFTVTVTNSLGSDSATRTINVVEPVEITHAFTCPYFTIAVRRGISWPFPPAPPDTPIFLHEVEAITSLTDETGQTTNIDGLEYLTALESIRLNGTQITDLTLPYLPYLKMFESRFGNLVYVDFSNVKNLERAEINVNQIASLDVSQNHALRYLFVSENQLATLDISNNHELRWLFAFDNQLTGLDVTNNPHFEHLLVDHNYMDSVNRVVGWQALSPISFMFGPQNIPIYPVITTETLPNGELYTQYQANLNVMSWDSFTWELTSGSLPPGIALYWGQLWGIPTQAGEFTFTLTAENEAGSTSRKFTIEIFAPIITVSISEETVMVGGEVTVSVCLTSNPGFAGMALRFVIPQGLTLIRYNLAQSGLEYGFVPPEINGEQIFSGEETAATDEVFFGWTGRQSDFADSGTFLHLRFATTSGAALGLHPITATFENPHGAENPTNYAGQEVTAEIVNGGVYVISEICALCGGNCRLGDINGDGRITSADGTWLARWIVGHDVQICLYAVDFYGVGVASPSDISVNHLTLLARWIMGHNVQIDRRNQLHNGII
ncbi:MAG: S8 family serine peptidase [Defluviitaleaceae bacterium]|nr:S8 family serine peptidase [Defluviitaleaceae bacterium]MCL2262238.1 S8 family serine peptidase [Defluviitaleaceae bacterium]